MYETHYNLSSDPFGLRPRSKNCFDHPSYSKALSYAFFAIKRGEGILLLTGPPGTGKTTLIRDCISQHSKTAIFFLEISAGMLDAEGLLLSIAQRLSITSTDTRKVSIQGAIESQFRELANNSARPIILIDEAQTLTDSALDEVKNLCNLEHGKSALVQIFLVGQPSLRARLQSPDLSQVLQRITAACELKALSKEETASYLTHCLRKSGWAGSPKISTSVIDSLFLNSGGIPRKINLVCSRLLLKGMIQNADRLDEADLADVIQDLSEEGLIFKANHAGS